MPPLDSAPRQDPDGAPPEPGAAAIQVVGLDVVSLPAGPLRAGRHVAARAWWKGHSQNLRSSMILLLSLVFIAAMMTMIKAVGARISVVEILLVRQLIMQALIVPFSLADFPQVLRTRHLGLQLVRGLLSLAAMWLGYAAVIQLTLAQATAISFTYAIFTTIGAALILKEKVGRRRWVAISIGLAGVLLMLRPGGDASLLYAFVALLGAVFGAGMVLSLRVLSRGDRVDTILTYQAIVLVAALAVPTALSWVTPTFDEVVLLVLIGFTGAFGQWLFTLAFRDGEAAALAPLDFFRLVLTTICGLIFFGELLDLAVMAGGVVVIGSTTYALRANAGRRRQPPRDGAISTN